MSQAETVIPPDVIDFLRRAEPVQSFRLDAPGILEFFRVTPRLGPDHFFENEDSYVKVYTRP